MMKKIRTFSVLFTFMLTLALPFLCAEGNLVYSLSLFYNGSYFTEMSTHLMEGTAADHKTAPSDGFLLKVIDEEGEVLHSFRFSVELEPVFQPLRQDVPVPPSPEAETVVTFVLTVPYFSNAKAIEIYNAEDKLLLTIDVSRFSRKKTQPTKEPLKNILPPDGNGGETSPQGRPGGDQGIPFSLGMVAIGAWIFGKIWKALLLVSIAAAGFWFYWQKRR